MMTGGNCLLVIPEKCCTTLDFFHCIYLENGSNFNCGLDVSFD